MNHFKKFRFRVIISLIIALTIVSLLKFITSAEHFLPYKTTNHFFNEVIQATKSATIDTTILLVNGNEFIRHDSTIGILVQKIAEQGPKVIVLDYMIRDSTLESKYEVSEDVHLVLGVPFDEMDSLHYPVNIFKGDVHYGHVMAQEPNEMLRESHASLMSLPEKVLQLFDTARYNEYKARKNSNEYINYVSTSGLLAIPADFVVNDGVMYSFKDKIIIIGEFGSGFLTIEPGFLDNVDVHDTPVGEQFGAYILYSETHTLLGNFINRTTILQDYILIVTVSLFGSILIFSLSSIHPKILYPLSKFFMIVLIILSNFMGAYFFSQKELFIDYMSICWGIIISIETSFWLTLSKRSE